jgi:hypothetical protein
MFQLVEGHCESNLSKSLPVLLVDKSWKQLGTNFYRRNEPGFFMNRKNEPGFLMNRRNERGF